MLHRTLGELDATMGSRELSLWVAMDRQCELPDLYTAAAKVCAELRAGLGGGASKASDFLRYFWLAEKDAEEAAWDDDSAIGAEAAASHKAARAVVPPSDEL